MKLPSVYDAKLKETASFTTVLPTFSTKKPIRQQPPGLKMRFRPIGFGNGATGTIGTRSSSVDGRSAESASDEESENAPFQFRRPASLEPESETSSSGSDEDSSSSSDAEMVDAPLLPAKSVVKSKVERKATKESSEKAGKSLKRKHSKERDIVPKSSWSTSTSFTHISDS